MEAATIKGFMDELKKESARQDIAQLLASKATRAGLNPSKLPAIQQVSTIAELGNRSRAAEVANSVRRYIRERA